MRYVMKQKHFRWGKDFVIRDEHGNDVFQVDAKVFTLRHTLEFQDMQGTVLASIHQKFLSWGSTYEVYRDDRLAAVVKKHLFTLLRCKFTVDVPGPDDLEATGSLLHYEYEFHRHDRLVATVSKRWFSFIDTYGVEIAEGEDDVLILAATAVIDLACHRG